MASPPTARWETGIFVFRQLLRDFIKYLADVKKIKINNEWMIEPIIAEQKRLLQQTGVTIP